MSALKRASIIILLSLLCFSLLSTNVAANSPPGREFRNDPGFSFWGNALYYSLLSFPGLVLTILSESLTAVIFRIGSKERNMIRWTNFISQVLMRVLFVSLYHVLGVEYLVAITLLEIMVYIGEFLIYRHLFKTINTIRVLLYTIMANTVSLLIGIYLKDLLLFFNT